MAKIIPLLFKAFHPKFQKFSLDLFLVFTDHGRPAGGVHHEAHALGLSGGSRHVRAVVSRDHNVARRTRAQPVPERTPARKRHHSEYISDKTLLLLHITD